MNKTHHNEEMNITSIYNVLNTSQENDEVYERSREDANHLNQNVAHNESIKNSEAIQSKIQNKTEMIDIEAEGDIIIEENTEVNSYDEKTKEPDITDINEIDEYGRYKLLNKQLKKEELKRRYDIIVFKHGQADEVACSLCKEEETFLNDEIVLCDLCDTAFHQTCYGSELLNLDESDDSEWFCHRCSYLLENNLPGVLTRCEFCPEMKGAMKRIQENSSKKWGHISCVESIIEVEYSDEALKVNVKIEDYLERNCYGRNRITCHLCKIKYGDCLQCDDTKCVKAFHVTCAQRHGLLLGWKDMIQLRRKDDPLYFYPVYCKEHMKTKNKGKNDLNLKLSHFEELYKKGEQISNENLAQGDNYSYLLGAAQSAEIFLASKENHKLEKQMISTKSKRNVQRVNKEESQNSKKKRGRPPKKHEPNLSKPNHEQKDIQTSPKNNGEPAVQNNKKDPDNKDNKDSNLKKRGAFPIKIKAMKSAPNLKKVESKVSPTDEPEKLDLPANLYKLHSELAKLMNFSSWVDEKGMKRKIQEYSRSKGLYDREAEELNVAKDPELKAILKISKIPRKKIFSMFKNFMSIKSSDNKKLQEINQDSNKITLEEKNPQKKLKSDNRDKAQKKLDEKIKVIEKSITKDTKMDVVATLKIDSDGDKDLENKPKNVNEKTEMNLEPLNVQKIVVPEFIPTLDKVVSEKLPSEEKAGSSALKLKKNASLPGDKKLERNKSVDTGDFMKGLLSNQKSSKLSTASKDSTINMNSSSFLENMFGSTKTAAPEKLKKENKIEKYGGLASIINGSDQIPFRTNMQWFMRSDETLQIESIFSPEVQAYLWPKGSEMLF